MDDKKVFGSLLFQLREKKNITLERLAFGLCTPSMLARIEKGERYPDKLLRERLLERLGVAVDGFETYLNIEEYNEWEERQKFVISIEQGRLSDAEEQLENYCLEHDLKKPLLRQFYLIMKLQIMKRKNCSKEERYPLIEEAMQLTVPLKEIKEIDKASLSIQELDLLVEYIDCSKKGIAEYKIIKKYIEAAEFDTFSVAKLYPKLMYYMCCAMLKEETTLSPARFRKMIGFCNKGLETLKTNKYMFYLWELLYMRRQILEKMSEMQEKLTQEEVKELWKELSTATEQEQVIDELCTEYGQAKEMADDCYLYREPEVNCIADVIRTRRRMFGLSRDALCEGICSLKTLERLETKQSNPQAEVVRLLFQRLRLPAMQYRTEIITDKQSDNELTRVLRNCINEKLYDKAQKILAQLEVSLDMTEIVNRQFVDRFSTIIALCTKKISRKDYVEKMQEIIEYTLPIDIVLEKKGTYLTNLEIGCFYNMTIGMDNSDEKKEECMYVLSEYYTNRKEESTRTFFSSYGLVMTSYASYLGNIAKYAESNEISEEILKACLKNRCMFEIARNLYNIYWNYTKCQESYLPAKEQSVVLSNLWKSIVLCQLAGQESDRRFLEQEWSRVNASGGNAGK